MLNLLKRAANTVPTPDANHVSVFIDAAGTPSVKNSAGTVTNLHGAAGADADVTHTMGVVTHGASASVVRPSGFAVVTWIGSVEPTNAVNHDIWEDTSV